MCVCVWWVNDQYEVSEDVLGLMQVPKTDSATLFEALEGICIRCVLPFLKSAEVKPMMVLLICQDI